MSDTGVPAISARRADIDDLARDEDLLLGP